VFFPIIQLLLIAVNYFFVTVHNPNKLNNWKKHGKSGKITKKLDYLGVFIDISLVLGKNQYSLAAKL